jgi:hypothetical protein
MLLRALAVAVLIANLVVFGLAWSDRSTRAPADAPPRAPASPPAGVDRLELLSERPAPAATADAADPADAPTAARPRPAAAICAVLGPLGAAEDAAAVLERARSLGLDGETAVREVPAGPPDYQVHLPPLPSLEQARRQVRELEALDVEAYVMGRSELEGAVSVGLFTEAERAEARRETVARLGYDVRVREVRRLRPVHEVRLRAPDAGALEAFRENLSDRWPDLAADPEPCDAPAPPAGARASRAFAGHPPIA